MIGSRRLAVGSISGASVWEVLAKTEERLPTGIKAAPLALVK
jgi:hypothetical protein